MLLFDGWLLLLWVGMMLKVDIVLEWCSLFEWLFELLYWIC